MGQTAYCAVRRLRAKICFGWTLALRSGFAVGSALGLGSGRGTGCRGLRTPPLRVEPQRRLLPQTRRAQPSLIRQPRSSGSIYRLSGRCSRLRPVASSARREAQRHQPSRHCHAAHRARTSPRLRRRCCARRRLERRAQLLDSLIRDVVFITQRRGSHPVCRRHGSNRKGRHPWRRPSPSARPS